VEEGRRKSYWPREEAQHLLYCAQEVLKWLGSSEQPHAVFHASLPPSTDERFCRPRIKDN
jgi:hypothetical protein